MAIEIRPFGPVPGSFYAEASNTGIQDSVSTVLAVALSMTRTRMEAGKYIVFWRYAWAYNQITSNFVGDQRADAAIQSVHVQEPDDASLAQRIPASGFYAVQLAAGDHTFDIRWAAGAAAQTARIVNVCMSLWRVSA